MTLQCIFCLRQNEALAFVLTISFIVVVEHLLCVTSDKLFIEDQQKEDERAEGMIARQEQMRKFGSQETRLEHLTSILSRAEKPGEKKKSSPAKRTKRSYLSESGGGRFMLELSGKLNVSADFKVLSMFIERVILLMRNGIRPK